MEKLKNNKNNPFDYKNFTGNNYKLKPKAKKLIVSIIIITMVLVFGRKGLLAETIDVKFYNIFDNEINELKTISINDNETQYDFYVINKTPTDIKIIFNSENSTIVNNEYVLQPDMKKFISLRIINITKTGSIKIGYEVEIQ